MSYSFFLFRFSNSVIYFLWTSLSLSIISWCSSNFLSHSFHNVSNSRLSLYSFSCDSDKRCSRMWMFGRLRASISFNSCNVVTCFSSVHIFLSSSFSRVMLVSWMSLIWSLYFFSIEEMRTNCADSTLPLSLDSFL